MNLATSYMGFELPHPLVPGAGPFADSLDTVRRLEDAGAPMMVMHSLFEEQVAREEVNLTRSIETPKDSYAEALSYFPEPEDFVLGPEDYLEQLRKVVRAVKGSVTIPVAVKLSPFYSSIGNFARRLDEAGADALVLFNRFYQPDIDVEEQELLRVNLSSPTELLLRVRWIGALSGRIRASLAATGGVHTAIDVVKAVMAGAHATQMVSALLQHGPDYLRQVRDDLARWLEEHEFESLRQMQGSMNLLRCRDPGAYQRANYIRLLQSWDAG
jgi:dihydroorotate dehydrogenase (fumarate)